MKLPKLSRWCPEAQARSQTKAAEGHQAWARGTSGERQMRRVGDGFRERCPLPGRLVGLEELHELPQWGPGQTADRKRILAYFWVTEHFWQTENAIFAQCNAQVATNSIFQNFRLLVIGGGH